MSTNDHREIKSRQETGGARGEKMTETHQRKRSPTICKPEQLFEFRMLFGDTVEGKCVDCRLFEKLEEKKEDRGGGNERMSK
jgi:hypothetical protein